MEPSRHVRNAIPVGTGEKPPRILNNSTAFQNNRTMQTRRKMHLAGIALALWLLAPANGWTFYNAAAGRWLSRDPLGETGGLQLYAAARSDLLNHYDLFGLCQQTDLGNAGIPPGTTQVCSGKEVEAYFDELRDWFNKEKGNFCRFPRIEYPGPRQ
jgi:hypothetical protein